MTIVAQSFLYKGRKPLDPPLSSASGYLPPRSVGVSSVSGSIHADVLSRSGTIRSRRATSANVGGVGGDVGARGDVPGSASRMGSMKSRLRRLKQATASTSGMYGSVARDPGSEEDDPERTPLLPAAIAEPSEWQARQRAGFGTIDPAGGAEPRYH